MELLVDDWCGCEDLEGEVVVGFPEFLALFDCFVFGGFDGCDVDLFLFVIDGDGGPG